MKPKKSPLDAQRQAAILAQLRRDVEIRQQGYRERALALFPHVCGSCGREFSGKKLRELTVHHKDHDHNNNPPDGSNWELLCLYCHENEHARQQVADVYGEATPGEDREPRSTYQPFADLKDLLQRKA